MLLNRILSLRVFPRKIGSYSERTQHQLNTAIKLLSSVSSNSSDSSDNSDSSSDSDNEGRKSKLQTSSKPVENLNEQINDANLSELKNASNEKEVPKIDLAIPKKPPRPKPEETSAPTQESKFEEKFLNAAKNVAKKLGGDTEKMESDLLNRLLKPREKTENVSSETSEDLSHLLKGMKVKNTSNEENYRRNKIQRVRSASNKINNLNIEFKKETSDQILRDLKGEETTEKSVKTERGPSTLSALLKERKQQKREQTSEKSVNTEKVSSALFTLLKESEQQEREKTTEKSVITERGPSTLSALLKERHQQERASSKSEETKPEYSRRENSAASIMYSLINDRRRRRSHDDIEEDGTSVLNSSLNGFGILKISTEEPLIEELSTWSQLEKREIKILEYQPPQNYFQEMIQWTDQGKVWHFPINNEQGMDEEEKVHFSEHVFMERHLKGWCPKHGPVRQFMELVCVGLSKNAFMTVDEKVQHIMWYKDYFGDKRELLQELGALENENPSVLPVPTNKIDLGPHV
ncbi:28S ribosomal protein S31, mitochondrial isoform X2 [Leptopilina heterotoma]|uniref:28S ribosomal protein S31, mitochondrial isoform X2 n=1 Tax=Leptopilina heterotoma TaxID=63436 RepID=UPI001CA93F24|nr:28S ribosomal protein S31, mitochondrial isoform X2 [Leptopilina heterotoma]